MKKFLTLVFGLSLIMYMAGCSLDTANTVYTGTYTLTGSAIDAFSNAPISTLSAVSITTAGSSSNATIKGTVNSNGTFFVSGIPVTTNSIYINLTASGYIAYNPAAAVSNASQAAGTQFWAMNGGKPVTMIPTSALVSSLTTIEIRDPFGAALKSGTVVLQLQTSNSFTAGLSQTYISTTASVAANSASNTNDSMATFAASTFILGEQSGTSGSTTAPTYAVSIQNAKDSNGMQLADVQVTAAATFSNTSNYLYYQYPALTAADYPTVPGTPVLDMISSPANLQSLTNGCAVSATGTILSANTAAGTSSVTYTFSQPVLVNYLSLTKVPTPTVAFAGGATCNAGNNASGTATLTSGGSAINNTTTYSTLTLTLSAVQNTPLTAGCQVTFGNFNVSLPNAIGSQFPMSAGANTFFISNGTAAGCASSVGTFNKWQVD